MAADRSRNVPSPPVSDRLLGWLTLVGAGLWMVALLIYVNAPLVIGSDGTYRDGSAALPLLVLASLLLGAGLIGVARTLPRGSDVGGLTAALAIVVGTIWSVMPWMFPLLLIASLCYVGLAIMARRAGVWGVADTALVLFGVPVTWSIAAIGLIANRPPEILYVLFWVSMVTTWLAVGHALVTGRASAIPERPVP